jgi:DNA replication protein DnaC
LNAGIAELVVQINNRVSRHLGSSRCRPSPTFAEWKECRVGLDYHVEIEKDYYSVPQQLLREKVWARITARTIEVFHRGKRVAAHVRSSSNRKHTTVREHMPSSHRRYADWTPERLKHQASEIGRHTSALVVIILRERAHPEQGFRACVGILRLAKTYGRERLEAACCRALEIGARSYSSVNSILKNNLDRQRPAMPADGPAIATTISAAPLTSTEEMTSDAHPTLDQLRALKLDGMAQAFVELEAQEEVRNLAHAEWLALLLDREAANRNTRRFQTRLRAARLRHGQPAIEDVDYRRPRRLDKALFQQLATCRWIADHRNLLVTGPCGVDKSWLSCALAQKACRDGCTVHYARVPRLFADLDLAHGDGHFARLFRMLIKIDLLVLDDWGPDRLSATQRRDLMEIVEDRHERGSILITSQLPVATWHEVVIGEPTLGDAILDRIVHNAYRLELDGPSMRKLKATEEIEPSAQSATVAANGMSSKGAKK